MLPAETKLALFPRRRLVVRLGAFRRSLALHPLTLGRAAAMEALGCGLLDGALLGGKAILAAWVLSLPDDEVERVGRGDAGGAERFVRRVRGKVQRVELAVSALVAEAVKPYIPPKSGGTHYVDDGLPRGCGWPLEVAEALCGHYGWRFDEAMSVPLQRAFALLAVCRIREGGEHDGPDYFDRIRTMRLKKAKAKRKEAANG